VSYVEDKYLLLVIDRGKMGKGGEVLPGSRCIRCCRNLGDILGRAFQHRFELHGDNGR
jgi:hypothetical protein